ncbi:MAG: hypothetical protein J7K31_03515 [Candidatus Aenigmarchaeota archaeon]|nr:hypothetical protein [Candidatus Aenigmarchaeota archaeon]
MKPITAGKKLTKVLEEALRQARKKKQRLKQKKTILKKKKTKRAKRK